MTRVRWLALMTVLGIAALAAMIAALIAWVGADAALKPDPPRDFPSLDAFPFEPLDVDLVSRDGTLLAGWFVAPAPGTRAAGEPAAAIVLVHAYGGTRDVLLPHASMLSAAGYAVLLFDERGAGHSSSASVSFGAREPLDVRGAVDYLERRADVDAARIGVLGVAMGGSVALMAAADDPRIRAVVAEAPYASLDALVQDALADEVGMPGLVLRPLATWIVKRRVGVPLDDRAPLDAAKRLGGRPVLLIEDSAGSVAGTAAIYEALPAPKTLWVAYGARTGKGLQEFPSEYVVRVLAFWAEAFGAR